MKTLVLSSALALTLSGCASMGVGYPGSDPSPKPKIFLSGAVTHFPATYRDFHLFGNTVVIRHISQ